MNKETLTVETDEHGTIRHYNASSQLHNENGPAVIYPDGNKAYYINGKLHNPDGPAVVWANGCKLHWVNGKLHNPDGPAVIHPNGDKEYWINNEGLSEAEFKAWQAQQSAPR